MRKKNKDIKNEDVIPNDTAKDFGKTVRKLISYLKSKLPFIIIAFILTITASIFSIIGPNKLSDLTDELSKGLVLNTKNLTKITDDLEKSLNEKKIEQLTYKILNIDINEEVIERVNVSNLSDNDKLAFNNFVLEISNPNITKEEIINKVSKLPLSVNRIILPSIKIDDVTISTEDRIKYINNSGNLNKESSFKDIAEVILNSPYSIKKILLPETKINNVVISTSDKVKLLDSFKGLKKDQKIEEIYHSVDKLPTNIRNLIKPKIDFLKIKKISLFLLVIFLLSALFNFLEEFIMATVSNDFARSLRTKITNKINRLALKYFDTHSNGDILSRVTNDIDTVGYIMSQSIGPLVSATSLFIGAIFMMFKTNWILALTAIGSSLLGFIFMFIVLGKSQKYFTQRQVELGKLNGHIEEIYSSHNVVKAYNGETDSSKKFDRLNENVFDCNRKSQFLSGLMPSMMNFIGNFGYVAVCIVGAILTMKGHITFGVIVAFMIYVRLFTSPLSEIAQSMSEVQAVVASAERVFEFLEEDEMEDESKLKKKLNAKKVKGEIEFSHVKFGYNEDRLIIKDFNCKVKPGQKIAIVGPTGAGKTTLVNLLMKFYKINDGDIKIDGVSVNELTRENIHKLFVMVLQDTWLFNGTVRDNIKYNKKRVSDKKIMEACKVVGIDHFVKSLPGGLNYEINDIDSVSAGEKQLLTIARGMIEDAPFLILDEATSSVDTRTEELVQKAMDKLMVGKTSFIIAHRLSTIKNADLILVMKDGNIIEQGTHNKLMKQNGFYADLYNSQFKK